MDPGRGIGRPRPAGDHAYAGATGELAVRLGHHRRPALLAADDGADPGEIVQSVDGREKALARNEEDPIASLYGELVDEDAAAVSNITHGRTPGSPASTAIPETGPRRDAARS